MTQILKTSLFLVIAGCCLFLTGCGKTELEKETTGMKTMQCSRDGQVDNGTASLKYEIFYQGEYIQVLHSTEKVTSNNTEVLDQYEKAYKDIFKNYEDLEYYDNTVTRDEKSITSDTVINYAKIDTKQLLKIEGEEDNVIQDGKVKLSTWVEFAKKYGTTCDEDSKA